MNSALEFRIEILRLVHHTDFPAVGQATGSPADNAQETVATENNDGHVRVHDLGLRTSDWTQRHKPVPTTRRRHAHFWLDATSATTEDNAHETASTQYIYGYVQVNHLGLHTCHWTQRLKQLPTAREESSSEAAEHWFS